MSPFAFVLLLHVGCGAGGDPPAGQATIEVLHYDYAFDLSSREASAELSLDVIAPGDCITLPFRARDAEEVRLDGEPARDVALEGETLAACGRGWEEGEEIALALRMAVPEETWGDSQVGYSVTTDLEGAPFSYMVSWIGGCDRFGPCDVAPSRFARYRFTINHGPNTQVLCSGTVEGGDGETICAFDMAGGPTYSTFGFMASPSWERHDLGTWGETHVTLYDMPSADHAGAIDVESQAAFLAWMEERFGPYPYGDELRLVVGPTYWNGFEHPGNISLSDLLGRTSSAYTDPMGHTIRHEIAHQWAGDQATLADTYDFVWKEAMAEYLTFVFEIEEMSASVGIATAEAWKSFSRFAAYYPVPLERPPLLDYYGDVYGPGPMILFRQLEALFSREQVLAAIADLLGVERTVSVEEVKLALEEATGADLEAYFDAWVYGEGAPTWPLFEVEIEQSSPEAAAEVTVRQVLPEDRLLGAAFEISLWSAGGAQRHPVWIDLGPGGRAETTVVAEPGFEVSSYVFDPFAHSLARLATRSAAPPAEAPSWLRRPWVARP